MNHVILLSYLTGHASGHQNAKTQWDIAEALEMSAREIRAKIEILRRQGYLIGSSPKKPWGYWRVPACPDEAEKQAYEDYLRRRHDKPIKELATLSWERRAFQKIFGKPIQLEWQQMELAG